MSFSRVIVTGGAGFIGSHLVERLLTDGREVVVIDDCSTGRLENLASVASHPRLRVIQTKVSECGELEELTKGAEAIYHLAAAVGVELVIHSPIRTIETNLRETEAVMSVAGRHGTPVLLASTSEVYGKSQKTAFSEEDDLIIGPPHLLRWSYACSKLMDEFLAMSYARERQLPVTVVRFFNTVGPRQTGRYGMVLPRFIAAAKSGAPLKVFGDGRQTRCFCLVTDVVEALTRLQRNPAAHGQVFNVGTDEEVSVGELAALVISVLGSTSSVELIPYGQAYAPGFEDMLRRRPLIDKLERVTGFRPATRLREIIEVTARTI
ncbi:MAG TPA: NAD-dependent epimerase/dehydratase family protein [Verrucomicrobiae bacterium]|nr:NAD-dependent epimerase/dehydratase family protein [Verrucomicrobiae bacterium]